MKSNDSLIKLCKLIRELLDHASSIEKATSYKKNKFNYGYVTIVMLEVLKENCTDDEIKEVYPKL